jgi:cellulose synthase/poly-beta-1,6-N-acetylglucosamine synthase-like glycosyltransferase
MHGLTWLFWLCFAVVAYTCLVYPAMLAALNCFIRRERRLSLVQTSVSFLLPVHNEERTLERRLDELTRTIQASGLPGEIIVISDASTDRSVEIARQFADRGVRVIEQPSKQGKAAALTLGAAAAAHELLIFADARQRWADDALVRLVENFADPAIGAVSGDLVLESAPGVLEGVGLYWRFEKWMRMQESRLGSQVGVTGAISAGRRSLFRPIPPGTLLDDVFWPMHVVLQGYRVVHDERAKAFDRLPENPRDEFRRKVRTLAGNFQLLTLLPASALLPWRNRVWWQFVSHKLFRLKVPWALLGMLISSFFLTDEWYQAFFYVQAAAYGLGLLGLIPALGRRVKLLGAAASFLVLNAAAWMAFWVWVTGRAGRSWHKVPYQSPK